MKKLVEILQDALLIVAMLYLMLYCIEHMALLIQHFQGIC